MSLVALTALGVQKTEQWFENQVALVTGGCFGIGRATALAFAARGASVVVASRRQADSAETVRLIEAAGGAATFVQTDVRHATQVEALVAATIANYGRLDYAFNNAGIEGSMLVPSLVTAKAFALHR